MPQCEAPARPVRRFPAPLSVSSHHDQAQVLPHNLDAERSALGSVLVDPSLWPDLAAILTPGDYFRRAHSLIHAELANLTMRGQVIDQVVLRDSLAHRGCLEDIGGPAYLYSLTDGVPRSGNVIYYARIVRDHSRRRALFLRLRDASASILNGEMAGAVAGLREHLDNEAAALDDTLLLEPAAAVAARERLTPARSLIEGLLPATGHWLGAGPERTMKSLTKRELAVAVASGRPALGLSRLRVPDVVPVCYLTEEDGAAAVLEHLDAFSDGAVSRGELPIYLSACKGLSLDDPRTQDRIIREVKTCGAGLVVIEPLRSMTTCVDAGPKDFQPFGSFLRRLVRETGAATALGHHTVKPVAGADGRRGTAKVSGGALVSYCESPVLFDRTDDYTVTLTPKSWKHSAAPAPLAVRLETQGGRVWRLIAEDVDTTATVDEARAEFDGRIVTAILKEPGLSTKAATMAARVNYERGRAALQRLGAAGVLRPVQRGAATTWYLAETRPGLTEEPIHA